MERHSGFERCSSETSRWWFQRLKKRKALLFNWKGRTRFWRFFWHIGWNLKWLRWLRWLKRLSFEGIRIEHPEGHLGSAKKPSKRDLNIQLWTTCWELDRDTLFVIPQEEFLGGFKSNIQLHVPQQFFSWQSGLMFDSLLLMTFLQVKTLVRRPCAVQKTSFFLRGKSNGTQFCWTQKESQLQILEELNVGGYFQLCWFLINVFVSFQRRYLQFSKKGTENPRQVTSFPFTP